MVAVCTVFLQGTTIGSLDSVEMLFKFIKPLVEEGEDDDEMDEEVRPLGSSPNHTVRVAPSPESHAHVQSWPHPLYGLVVSH